MTLPIGGRTEEEIIQRSLKFLMKDDFATCQGATEKSFGQF